MKPLRLASAITFCILVMLAPFALAASVETLYTQVGTDPTWQQLKESGKLILGHKNTSGVTGSKIKVNLKLLDVGPNAHNPIEKRINIHTLGNSHVPRKDFDKWTRWYQEDGNVQIFRLFKDETNVRNGRPLAARIEAYCHSWKEGKWHEWTGEYTIIKPGAACIFQVFNNKRVWAVHLGMSSKGDVGIDPRHHRDGKKQFAHNMVGKPFFIRVLDNGNQWRVYFNGKFIESGSFPCPKDSKTNFRWGMYKGESAVRNDTMYFVTGATVRTLNSVPKDPKADEYKYYPRPKNAAG